MFDGVHRGHQFVLQHVVDEAHQRGLQSMAITFIKTAPQTLTPLVQKRILLTKTGIDRIEVLTFDDSLKQMTARQFMEQVLRDKYGVKVQLYNMARGNSVVVRCPKPVYNAHPLKANQCIFLTKEDCEERQRYTYRDGEKVPIEGVKDFWIKKYRIQGAAA